MGNFTTRTNNMNQEFRRRLVKQIQCFYKPGIYLFWRAAKYTLTLLRVERMPSLLPSPSVTFHQFLARMNSSVISREPGLHGGKHYLVLHNIELSARPGYKMTVKHEPDKQTSLL